MAKIELSNFQYVNRQKKKDGLALRFTLAFGVIGEDGERYETAWKGNIALYRWDGKLLWNPPLSYYSIGKAHQDHYVSPAFYDAVKGELAKHPELLEKLETSVSKLLKDKANKSIKAQDLDNSLPKILETTVREKKDDTTTI